MDPAQTPILSDGGLRGICEAVWRIEAELDLFRQQVAGIFYWRLIRWEVCRALTQKAKLALGAPGSAARPLAYRIEHEIGAIRKSLKFPNWTAGGPVDTIVVPFPRKHLRNGVRLDIHSDPVLNDPAFGRILALERTEADTYVESRQNVFVADRDRGRPEAVARAMLSFAGLLAHLRPVHAALERATRGEFGVGFPISLQSLALRVALFREYRAVSRRMLRATGARRLIAAWHDQVMFAAAADLGLETVEIQHAAFSKYNLHYHFPFRGPVPYFAEYFLTFGQYWIDSVDLPANTRCAIKGSGNMEALAAEPTRRRPRRAVVSSQGPTYWPLLDCILDAAALAGDWEFIVRPHPRENLSRYKAHIAARGGSSPNLRLSDPAEDFYSLIKSADLQIGVASTALFEGMKLGCRTVVFEAPGSEAMDDVVEASDASLASTPQDILACLASAPRPHDPQKYYADAVPVSAILPPNGNLRQYDVQ